MAKRNKPIATEVNVFNSNKQSQADPGDESPLASQEYFSSPDQFIPTKPIDDKPDPDEVNEFYEYTKSLDPAEHYKPEITTDIEDKPIVNPDIRIGSYKLDGVLYFFADSLNIHKVNSYDTKSAIWNHRFAVNMPNAGIETYGSSYIVNDSEEPPALFKGSNVPVYRVVYKVTNGL